MVKNLLYASSSLILISYLCYVILIVFNRKRVVTRNTGFDIIKDMISEYNSINIILSKGMLTYYNIKRKVIKLSNDCYYGNSLSEISIALLEAGISVVDDKKNKFINICMNLFSTLKYLYIFPILVVVINSFTFSITDAQISIVFLIIFTFITYMYINIKCDAYDWISNNINKFIKNNNDKILSFINKIILFDKFMFIGELLSIIRLIAIIINL